MALAEAALEELGLAPVWVRRGIARAGDVNEDATGAARETAAAAVAQGAQPVASDASREPAHRSSRDGGQDGARGGVADSAAFARDAADPARASTAPAPAARTGGDAGAAEPDEDMSWFDLEPVREPALPDVAAKPAAVAAGAEPSVAELGWDALRARVADCERCRLCEKRTNTVFGVGDESADWMLVGEAPGENEDKQGEPFVGQAGKLLDNMLRALALKRGENVYIANVIKCRPPGNRNPEPDEVARCEPYLQRQVALVKPKLIVALGRFAAQTLLKTDASIASMRGRVHRYEGVPVIVTYHPAYLLRSLQDKAKAWSDLCLANDTYRNAAPAADPQ